MDLFKKFQGFSFNMTDNVISVTLPVLMSIDGGFLELEIKQSEDKYQITLQRTLFDDANNNDEFYFKVFEKYDKNYHYGIFVRNGKFCKEYNHEFNPIIAVNEFIRYFILLDDFILGNDVIGHEENFPV